MTEYFDKKNRDVVELTFDIDLENFKEWINSEGELDIVDLDKPWYDWGQSNNDSILTYKIDLLPHPDEKTTLFYHRDQNVFSNYLTGSIEFIDSDHELISFYEDGVERIEFGISKDGFLNIAAYFLSSSKMEKSWLNIFSVPTNKINQLHIGNRLDKIEEGTVEFKNSSNDVNKKVKQFPVSIGGRGIGYLNKICRVKACKFDHVEYVP